MKNSKKKYNSWSNLDDITKTGEKQGGTIANRANFEGANLREATLRGTLLIEANLEEANLYKANLKDADLRSANLSNANVTGVIYNKDNIFIDILRLISKKYREKHPGMQCRGIRADTCYGSSLFKRHVQDLAYLEEFKDKHPAIYWLWKISSDCGRSFALWAFWSVLISFIFAAVYFWGLGESAFDYTPTLGWSLWTMVCYSVVALATLGFGDITPLTTSASTWVMAEVILGYIMLGGLISIFANKLARRS